MMDLYAIRNELAQGRSIYDVALRATFYARVSSDRDEQLHSLRAQAEYFRGLIGKSACWQYVEGYIDEGISGTSVSKRASFLRMIDDAHQGKFDFIITKEVSRFARNTLDSIRYTQDLLAHGVGVLFQADNINTLLPDSELRLTIMASVAQDEVRKTSERVKFGFRRAIEKGVVLGSNRIWGYRKDQGRLVVVEEEARMVRRIYELFALERLGMRAIGKRLSEEGYCNSRQQPLSFSTIAGILSNPKYKGYYCGNKTHKVDYKLDRVKRLDPAEWVMYRAPEQVPPIVSEELWEQAARLREQRSRKFGKSEANHRYPYSGKIICLQHQTPFYRAVYKYRSGSREVWQCREYAQKGRAGCLAPVIYTDEADQIMRRCLRAVLPPEQQLTERLLEIYQRAAAPSEQQAGIAALEREAALWRQRQDRLLDLNIAGQISDEEFAVRNQRYAEQLDAATKRLEQRRQSLSPPPNPEELLAALRQRIGALLSFPQGFSNGLMDALLQRIEVASDADGGAALRIFLRPGLLPKKGQAAAPEADDLWGSVALQRKPRQLLFDPDDTYHPRRYQHGNHPADRHREAV